MIGSLRGRLLARSADAELLVEVSGIGYRVQVTPTTAAAVGDIGSEVFLYVCQIVREDSQTLFGFLTLDERQTFEALVAARGVGPSLGLAIVAVHRPDALRRAVATDDVDSLCLVSGVGPKTAVRLLVELKSKLHLPEAETPPVAATSADSSVEQVDARADVRVALEELGYSGEEAARVLAALPAGQDGQDAEGLLRTALQRLAAGISHKA